MSPAPINIFKSFLKMSYIIKKCQIIAKKFENLTLPLWRPIEQGKIRRTIFHCVFYYIVCKSEYILGSLFFRINIFKNLLKMSYILKKQQIISKTFENLTLPLWRPIEQGKIRRWRGCDEKERYETPSNIHRNKHYNHSIIQNAMPYRTQGKYNVREMI